MPPRPDFLHFTTGSLQRLVHSDADASDSASRAIKRSRNNGVDFLALSDHHDFQVYKPTGAYIDVSCSGAVGIDV